MAASSSFLSNILTCFLVSQIVESQVSSKKLLASIISVMARFHSIFITVTLNADIESFRCCAIIAHQRLVTDRHLLVIELTSRR